MSQPFAADPTPLSEHGCASPLPAASCLGMNLNLSEEYSAVDLEQALEDFNGNHLAVEALLREFLADRGRCAVKLADLAGASAEHVVAVLHDVANTLDAGWCRLAAMAVRRREERLRRGGACVVESLVAEVHAIVQHAFDGVEILVGPCPQCLAGRMV